MKFDHFIKITGFFVFIKSIQLFILSLIPSQFDTSSQIILNNEVISQQRNIFIARLSKYIPQFISSKIISSLSNCVIWDAVYFTDLFVNPINFEHSFVFGPLWWRLIKHLPILNETDTFFYSKLALGVIVSNLCHYLSCIVLYYLTTVSFNSNCLKSRCKSGSLSLKVSLIYVISPAGIFLTAPYSESLCALLSFTALYFREISIDRKSLSNLMLKNNVFFEFTYILSGIFVALAFGVRTNSLLLGYLYINDLYYFQKSGSIRSSLLSIISGSILFFGIIISNYYPYSIFCPRRGEWCNNTIPSLFTYAQKQYWNNGFLSYWTPNNIPNFIFALPTISLLLLSCNYFTFDYPCFEIYPIVNISRLLLIGGVFFWHVQILTRIASSIPIIYWYIGDKVMVGELNSQTSKNKEKNEAKVDLFTKSVIIFLVIWILVQTALFGSFLPPA